MKKSLFALLIVPLFLISSVFSTFIDGRHYGYEPNPIAALTPPDVGLITGAIIADSNQQQRQRANITRKHRLKQRQREQNQLPQPEEMVMSQDTIIT